jgi:hypothetical protein
MTGRGQAAFLDSDLFRASYDTFYVYARLLNECGVEVWITIMAGGLLIVKLGARQTVAYLYRWLV